MKRLLLLAACCLPAGVTLLTTSARAITLYATDATNQSLYTIDTATFQVGLVGQYTIPSNQFFVGGACFDWNATLYGVSAASLYFFGIGNAVDRVTNALWKID